MFLSLSTVVTIVDIKYLSEQLFCFLICVLRQVFLLVLTLSSNLMGTCCPF